MLDFLQEQQWLVIAAAFFGIIAYIAFTRWRDRQWIEARFGADKILAMSFGVSFWGRANEPGKPRRSGGFLLLRREGLFFRSRVKKIEVDIPAAKIARVYHERAHKGVDLHQSLVKVDFINADGQRDTVAFKVPYPPQWIRAIENTLVKKP